MFLLQKHPRASPAQATLRATPLLSHQTAQTRPSRRTMYSSSAVAVSTRKTGQLKRALVWAILSAALFLPLLAALHSHAYYAGALKQFKIRENVYIDGTQFLVENGDVTAAGQAVSGTRAYTAQRLAYAKTLAARNPILSLPVSDMERLEQAITELVNTRERLATLQENAMDADLVHSHLYPIEFLKSLRDTEEARRRLISDGSKESLEVYEQAVARALNVYVRNGVALRNAFEQAVPKDIGPYIVAGDRVTRYDVTRNMQTLIARGRVQRAHALIQKACLQGFSFLCKRSDISLPVPQDSGEYVPTAKERAMAEDIAAFMGPLKGRPLDSKIRIALPKSICAENMPGAPLFVLQTNESAYGSMYEYPLYIGDFRFTDSSVHRDVPFYEFFLDRGVRFVPNPAHNYYACPDVGFDAAQVHIVERIVDTYPSALRDMQGPITLRSVTTYLKEQLALKDHQNATSTEIALAQALKNNSAGFEDTIFWLADIEAQNARIYQDGVPVGLDLPYLFYVRSGYSVLLMAHDPRLWPPNRRLYDHISLPIENQPFVYYSQIRTTLPRDEFARGIQYYFDVHSGLIEIQR